MVKLASEREMSCPRFVAVDSFLPCAFLVFCHSEDIPAIFTVLSLLLSLFNGVRVLTDDIVFLAKARRDSRGLSLFGLAFVGFLRCTQSLAHRIGATVVAPRRDEKAPRADYRDLFRRLDAANLDFFAVAMAKCIDVVAVKLHGVFDDIVDNIIDKFLVNQLLHHVYLNLKVKRGDGIRRVADAIGGGHASHATAVNDSYSLASASLDHSAHPHSQPRSRVLHYLHHTSASGRFLRPRPSGLK